MKQIVKYIVIVILSVSFISCEKEFLETKPSSSVSPSVVLSSTTNMITALNGIHRTMYAQNNLDVGNYAGESYIMPMLEYPASDFLHTTSGNGWFRRALQWLDHTNENRGSIEWIWYHYYHIIGNANQIINGAEGFEKTKELNNVLGQAYAYRAFAHFRLVSLFAKSYMIGNPESDEGIPIMLKTEAPYEGHARSTVAKVYEQINADIDKAIELLNEGVEFNDNSNISKYAANGIAARVALTQGNWQKALDYAKEAKKGGGIMSNDNLLAGFNSSKVDGVLWGAEVVADQTNYYYAWFYYIGVNFNGTQVRGNPKIINKKLYDKISETDIRKQLFLEKAPNSIAGWQNDDNYATKDEFNAARSQIFDQYGLNSRFKTHPYMSVKFRNENGGSIEPEDMIYMRVAEMYLIEAEAAVRLNDNETAANVLYDLVSVRDDSYSKSTNTGDALLDEILLQRRIELFGEGHRWLDMLRNDEELDREGTGANKTLYSDGFKQAKPSENDLWIYKIPIAEKNANPNIK